MLQSFMQRRANAETAFAATLAEFGKIDHDTARRLAAFYIRRRLAKIDNCGQCRVVHGAYLDPQAIARAVDLMNQ